MANRLCAQPPLAMVSPLTLAKSKGHVCVPRLGRMRNTMKIQYDNQDHNFFSAAVTSARGLFMKSPYALSVILSATLFSFTAPSAHAQQTPYYDLSTAEVSVDLSVLNNGGMGAPRTGAMSPYDGGGSLLMPGGRPPQSQLLVSPPRKPRAVPRVRQTSKRKTISKKRLKSQSKSQGKPQARPKRTKVAAASTKRKRKPARNAPMKTTLSAAPPPPPQITSTTNSAAKTPPPAPASVSAPTTLAPAKTPMPKPAVQQAALPPASTASPAKAKSSDQSVLVEFSATSTKVSASMKPKLKTLAANFKGKSDQRLQLKSYAGGKDISPSKARRLSLSRALSVRSYLISTGVRSTRIDVRALGNKTTEQPINRVDVTIVKR